MTTKLPGLEAYARLCLATGTDHEVLCGRWSDGATTRRKRNKRKRRGKAPKAAAEGVSGDAATASAGAGAGAGAGAAPTPAPPQESRNGGAPGILKVAHSTGFRGTARWIGSDVVHQPHSAQLTLFGMTEVGTLFVVDHAERMVAPATTSPEVPLLE